MPVESPCIRFCELNEKGICEGCGRTEYEIEEWQDLSDEQKQAILDRVKNAPVEAK